MLLNTQLSRNVEMNTLDVDRIGINLLRVEDMSHTSMEQSVA